MRPLLRLVVITALLCATLAGIGNIAARTSLPIPAVQSRAVPDGVPGITVALPIDSIPHTVPTNVNVIEPVTTTLIDNSTTGGADYVSFSGHFFYDSAVINFASSGSLSPPVQKAGLTSGNWFVQASIVNTGPGTIKELYISAVSLDSIPLNGSGTLFELRPFRVGATGTSTLSWRPFPENFVFDSEANSYTPTQTNGQITITTTIVTNTNDSGPGSLRQALADAQDGGTIQFDPALNGQTITLTTAELVIDKSITINGPGANLLTVARSTAAGTPQFRIFHILPNHTVAIQNLTISNGVTGSGGAVANDQATLDIDYCTVTNNLASIGGGIVNTGTFEVSHSLITSNTATYVGGGISNEAAGLLTITDSTVSNNSSTDFHDSVGGGIYHGSSQTLTIRSSHIDGNHANADEAAGGGGGIWSNGPIETIDSTINGNIAVADGGGIYQRGGPTTITRSTINQNGTVYTGGGICKINSGNLTIIDSTFSGNNAGLNTFTLGWGGGIYHGGGTLTILNSTFNDNRAESGGSGGSQGAGIYCGGNVSISNSTFSGNFARINGGAIFNRSNPLTITNCTFSNNTSNGAAGGIISGGNNVVLQFGNTILKAGASGANIVSSGTGTITSLGYNLSSDNGGGFLIGPGDQINTDPILGPLQNNGGPTSTHALSPGSPAINTGNPAFTPPPLYDQRGNGYPRVVNGRIDIGSFEVQPAPTPTPTPTPCLPVITQSSSQAITAGNSASCNDGNTHTDNSYWRAFDMTAYAGGSQYHIDSVSFGVEFANTTQPVTVRLYITSNFPTGFPGSLTQIATTTVNVSSAQNGTVVTAPLVVTVPAGTSQLVMELFTPNGQPGGYRFFVGSNAAMETAPSYFSAPACGFNTPMTTAAIGFPNMHIVFNVNGHCLPPSAPSLGNYPNTSVSLSGNTTVTPDATPANTTSINVSTDSNFKGTFAANPTTGVVTVTDAHPVGTYPVTVTACGPEGAAARMFVLTVTNGVPCGPNLTSSFANAANVNVGSQPQSVAIGDFNGDGKQDLAVANVNSAAVSIRLGDGLGGFSGSTEVGAGNGPVSIAIGDFNGDGKQDLAIANYNSGTVSIRLGDGGGGFSGTTNVSVGTTPFSVVVGDFNGDGKQDLAAANSASITVAIRLGDGLGGFSGTTSVAVGSGPVSIAVGDFNADNKQDLAVANASDSTVTIRLGNGSGGFGGSTNLSVGSRPQSVATGDFNGDGKQDLAVANSGGTTVSIRLGNGLGGFTNSPDVSVGSGPVSVAIGDFNRDGKQDLAVANYYSNTVSVRPGDGLGGFSGSTNVGVGSLPYFLAVGDFNGDADQDFATANYFSNTASIRLGQCVPFSTPSPTPTPQSCQLTQSTSQAITTPAPVCVNPGPMGGAFNNYYWRAFDMQNFAGGGEFMVSSVGIGVAAGSGTATVRLYANNGAPFPAAIGTQIGSTTLTITPGQAGTVVNTPLVAIVPAETNELVMELFEPLQQTVFRPGGNTAPETGPSYWNSAEPDLCPASPTVISTHLVFNINGTCTGPSPTPTPTPCPLFNISGTVGQCTTSGPSGATLPGVTMTLSPGGTSILTDNSGFYILSGFSCVTNTVTPTKAARPPGSEGINTIDVLAVQRHFLALGTPLSGCRLIAADCAAPVGITTGDVIAIQRYFLFFTLGIGNVGQYSFTPPNRVYSPPIINNQTGQNYAAIVFGDVSPPFATP